MVATATGRVTMLRAGLPGGGMNPVAGFSIAR